MHIFGLKRVTFKSLVSIQSIGLLKALYTSPLDRPVHSDTNLTSLGSIQPCCNILRKDYSLTFHPQSIAGYSFLQLSELRHPGEKNCTSFKISAKEFKNRPFRIIVRDSTAALPCCHLPSLALAKWKYAMRFLLSPTSQRTTMLSCV